MTVIVIGGGIGGLSAAIALRRAGVETHVYERVPELADVGAGLSIWRNALVALDAMDLGDAVRHLGAPYHDAGLRRWDGRVLVSTSLEALTRAYGEVAVVVHRAALQTVLTDALGRDRLSLGRACACSEDGTRRFAS